MLDLHSWYVRAYLTATDGEFRVNDEAHPPCIVQRVLTTAEQTTLSPELSWVDIVDVAPMLERQAATQNKSPHWQPVLQVVEASMKLIGQMSGIPINHEHDELVAQRLRQRISGRMRRLV